MLELLIDNPLLLLFVVSAVGYLIGRIKIGGISLGVAAVLFVGLAFGALDPELRLPEIVYLLGLVLFVYTVGLSSGPGFFASLQRKGLRDNLLVLGIILFATGLTLLAAWIIGLSAPTAAGMFAGSLTNTPALAGVIEQLKTGAFGPVTEAILAHPVIGYSVTYPMGVLGMILAIYLLQRLWKINYADEARTMPGLNIGTEHLVSRTIRVTRPEMDGRNIGELLRNQRWNVVFGRIQHDGLVNIVTSDAYLRLNDLVSVVGQSEEVERVATGLGELTPEQLELDRHTLDFRRVFVSNPAVLGKRLRDLDLPHTQGAIITRVRRGDIDILPHGDTILEPGDRVRVVTRRENLEAISKYFGDSYRHLSEIDVVSLGLGLALGLLVGMIPIPLPGGMQFTLGFAGGPLIVALILGWLERTGPIVWSLPYSANLTLRQLGLTFFLAGVGTRSGYSFVSTFSQGGGLGIFIFIAGALITAAAAFGLLIIGHKMLKIPMGICIGMLAGMQTQPAVLAFANEQAGNDLPNIGYATVYPLATIGKIICAQMLLVLVQ
ncbi:transporter [Candidatus Chloroploca sp. M-50]|uniref:Transporter n=1 Tax=Candidatus Chloroploca mongolica TaxID=2528176 RepID=A0ABS4D5H9_9CHLR|nr:aspartate:alanine exchanger family transporter [Candidatus Chloroploca mongolica]MBP1464691.1 transporter [Candidatus Chloroploca mongolica]